MPHGCAELLRAKLCRQDRYIAHVTNIILLQPLIKLMDLLINHITELSAEPAVVDDDQV